MCRPSLVANPRLSDATLPMNAALMPATKHEPRLKTVHPRSSLHVPKHSRKPQVVPSPQRRLRAIVHSSLGALATC